MQIFVLYFLNPTRLMCSYLAAADTYSELEPFLASTAPEEGAILTVSQFAGEPAETIREHLEASKEAGSDEFEKIELVLEEILFSAAHGRPVPDFGGPEYDDMDGDAESALASAGMGTDEDYGYQGGDD